MVLRDEYPNVGIVSPSFQTLSRPSKGNVLLEVLDAPIRRTSAVGSIGLRPSRQNHQDRDKQGVCFMFDPLQLERNYAVRTKLREIEKCVWSTIEELLQLEDMLTYKSSCGVWSIPYWKCCLVMHRGMTASTGCCRTYACAFRTKR
ncbi:hypothetical protein GQ600_4607 [Phytophthora cactorum]|nr:hypothetical protein GQ600_4607 [Phytophthora cactorum]